MGLILHGRKGGALAEKVEHFKCLGCPLYQTYDNWTEVWQNAKRVHKVWGRFSRCSK